MAGLIWGVALALAVGAIMGLSGAGGSILTVPILVYVVGVDAVTATAYSLFVVGVTSTVGAASYWRRGLVNVRAAVAFSIPSLVVVFFTRSVLVPAIPAQLGTVAGMAVSKDLFILVLFAVIMALAALSMIAKPRYRLSLTEPPGPAGEPRAAGSRVARVTEGTRPLTGHGVDGDGDGGSRSGPPASRSTSAAPTGTGWDGTAVPRSAGAAEAAATRDARRAGAKAEAGRATEPRTAPGQGPAGTGPTGPVKVSVPLAALEGTVIGVFTGVVGAGGGFAIVPALVVLSRLPMRVAVGTSLTIIAAKSLAGFAGDVALQGDFDWGLLLAFTALAVVGILAGSRLGRHVPGARLRPAFGWFVLVAAAGILVRELLLG
ncbi:MAG: sulfite exporter TauE/SafE family protein [Spirochaetaceae bacterium]|nr:sulfite exporter TauE/SafE family protein [Spirochaetaceae bacterium]